MTNDQWDRIVEAAISECDMKATVYASQCSPNSVTCSATVQEDGTGKLIEVTADRTSNGDAQMRESVVQQLRAETSN